MRKKLPIEPFKRFGIDIQKDKSYEGAVYALVCVFSLMEKRINEYLRPFKLTPAKFNALLVIKHRGKSAGLSQVDIGRHLIVSESNMTRLLDKLLRDKLIVRCSLAGDRRVNMIKITEKGSCLLDQVWPGYTKKIKGMADLLPSEEISRIAELLIKWFERIERAP